MWILEWNPSYQYVRTVSRGARSTLSWHQSFPREIWHDNIRTLIARRSSTVRAALIRSKHIVALRWRRKEGKRTAKGRDISRHNPSDWFTEIVFSVICTSMYVHSITVRALQEQRFRSDCRCDSTKEENAAWLVALRSQNPITTKQQNSNHNLFDTKATKVKIEKPPEWQKQATLKVYKVAGRSIP